MSNKSESDLTSQLKANMNHILFVQQKCKHGEMTFLTSRSASKHVLFALGVNPIARDADEGRGSDLVSQATPFAVSCETSSCPCSLATQV